MWDQPLSMLHHTIKKLKFLAVAKTSYYTPSRPVVPLAAERWQSCSARELPVDLQAHLLPTLQTHELCSWSHRVKTAPKRGQRRNIL